MSNHIEHYHIEQINQARFRNVLFDLWECFPPYFSVPTYGSQKDPYARARYTHLCYVHRDFPNPFFLKTRILGPEIGPRVRAKSRSLGKDNGNDPGIQNLESWNRRWGQWFGSIQCCVAYPVQIPPYILHELRFRRICRTCPFFAAVFVHAYKYRKRAALLSKKRARPPSPPSYLVRVCVG